MQISHALIVILFFCSAYTAKSCDVCGGGGVSPSLGYMPKLNKHFVGARYATGFYKSQHTVIDPTDQPLESEESFHYAELRARYVMNNGFQFFIFIPYQTIIKEDPNARTVNAGIGDISIQSSFKPAWFNPEKTAKHTLLFNGGIKIPTGNYNVLDNSYEIWIPNLQLGTGSWDFHTGINYIFQYESMGLINETFVNLNTTNPNQYRFGNRYKSQIKAFYAYEAFKKETTWITHLGYSYEHLDPDKIKGFDRKLSGGFVSHVTLGTELFFSHFNLSAQIAQPISYFLSDGFVTPKTQFQIIASYLF